MEMELTRLASFPQLNPHPIVKADLAGRVHYSNPAAERLFPDLKKAGLNHPWLINLEKISEALETEPRKTYVRELRAGDQWYQQTIHPVMEGTRLRIYGFDITERKRAEEALRDSEDRLRRLSSQLLTVQETERRRISREIHDGLGQSLSAIKFKVEDITQDARRSPNKKMVESLEIVIPVIQASIEESRRIQMDLRPSTLDDLGILATIEWFCREYQKIYHHIRIEKKVSVLEDEVSIPLKTAIYRVIQEALNNIAKHSKADLVHLSLRKEGDKIELEIKDNGIGFDIETVEKGVGLDSMRERAELSGGAFTIESTIGRGTTIRACWLCVNLDKETR
jgi:signal transduction histidine kinase